VCGVLLVVSRFVCKGQVWGAATGNVLCVGARFAWCVMCGASVRCADGGVLCALTRCEVCYWWCAV
jgi:hypothetical protein